jgi:hypothetical protein
MIYRLFVDAVGPQIGAGMSVGCEVTLRVDWLCALDGFRNLRAPPVHVRRFTAGEERFLRRTFAFEFSKRTVDNSQSGAASIPPHRDVYSLASMTKLQRSRTQQDR